MATPVPDESTCVSVVVDQVGQVCNAAAGVASYVTGNAAIAKAVEKLLQLVDFFIQVIFTLIKTVQALWKSYMESKTVAGFISMIMAFVIEKDEQFGQAISTLKNYSKRSLASGRNVGWRIPGQRGPLGEALRGPQQLWDKILDSAVDLVFNFEKHHQRVGFASPGDSVMQVMENSGLKKTQVDKASEGAAVDQGLLQRQDAKSRYQAR